MQIPLSLYIHIPWCVKKCPYCDFNSHQAGENIPEMEYVKRLIDDLESELPSIWGRKIQTIFFGGGTPSLLSPKAFDQLLKALHTRLCYSPDIEITLEANPGTVEQKKFKAFRDLGINRLSLGIQSFQNEKLSALGRIHNAEEANKAIETAKLAGFTNFNLDLMFGLPDQCLEEALCDLKVAIAHQPTHLSWYQLTLEPNTRFFQFPPELPEHDDIADMQIEGQALLASASYHPYEVSAYCRQGFQCQHNMNYWQFGDYLGIGAGAHSKITDAASGNVIRKWKIKHPRQYLNSHTWVAGEKFLSSKELPFEFLMNALRLYERISMTLFHERVGQSIHLFEKEFKKASDLGLLEWDDQSFATTPLGKRFLNDLLQIFYPSDPNC